jgi:hypothetical protein
VAAHPGTRPARTDHAHQHRDRRPHRLEPRQSTLAPAKPIFTTAVWRQPETATNKRTARHGRATGRSATRGEGGVTTGVAARRPNRAPAHRLREPTTPNKPPQGTVDLRATGCDLHREFGAPPW